MKQHRITAVWLVIMIIATLASCTKRDLPLPIPNPNQPHQGGGGQQQPQVLKIKVQAIIKIGDIVYDSIPASFTLTSYDSSMQPHLLNIRLKPGVNEISIPANHIRYRLLVREWNHSDEMTLDRNNIQEDVIYTLGGAKAAKKMKYELNAVLVNGTYRAESKTEYQYDASGKLVKVLLFKKRTNGDVYIAATEDLIYQDGKVTESIKRDENGNEISKLFIGYDQQGKIKSFKQSRAGEETNGTVSYTIKNGAVETHIKHINSQSTVEHYILSIKGNQIRRSSVASNNINEWSDYGFDNSINPYIHMNWPDMQMLRNSKNNVSWTGKQYYEGNLTLDPVKYNYTYDGDGYPVSLVKEFRSAQTGSILNTTKTTYHY